MFLLLVVAFYFPLREVPLVFGAKLVSLVLYSLSFCLSVKLLISPWNLRALLGRVFLVVGSFLSSL